VGLTGELRPVNGVERRIKEAAILGFSKFILPKNSIQNAERNIQGFCPVGTVEEALRAIFAE
jgi:DNA repair protein RadA/Sms